MSTHEHAVRTLIGAYRADPPSDDQMGAYLVALVDLDADAVFDAVVRLVRTARRRPTPAAVRAEVLLAGDAPPGAAEAWDEVQAMARTIGHLRLPVFSHPLVGKTVRLLGGWMEVCASETPDTDRDLFMTAFGRLAAVEARDRLLAPGPGGW